MFYKIKLKVYSFLRSSEKYTETDMIYLTRNISWMTFSQIINSFSVFLLSIAFANLVSKDVYGVYRYVLSTMGLLAIFSLTGMGNALSQNVAKGYDNSLKFAYKTKIKWGIIPAILSLIVGAYYLLNGNYSFAIIYAMAGITFPFIDAASLYNDFLYGKTAFKRSAIFGAIQQIVSTIVFILAILFYPKSTLVFILLYLALQIFFTNFWYRKVVKNVSQEKETDTGIINYAKHSSAINILSIIADKIDSIIIFQFLNPAQLAIYSFAIAPPEQIKALIKNIVPISMPKFANRQIDEIKKTLWKKMLLLFAGIVTTVIIYYLTAPLIYKIFFPQYLDSVRFSQIYAISLVFTFATPIVSIFQAHKKVKELYFVNNLSSIVLILAVFTGVYFYGLMGAILGQMVYRASTAMLSLWKLAVIKDEHIS